MEKVKLVTILRGRDIHTKVIPTVCNLRNMLKKLKSVEWKYTELKDWEKRSYQAYQIESIVHKLKESSEYMWIEIIKHHILTLDNDEIGASCLDIYFVAYVAELYGTGKEELFEYVKKKKISNKIGSANAIYQVGRGDGIYLGLLNDNGTIKDTEFFNSWINEEKRQESMYLITPTIRSMGNEELISTYEKCIIELTANKSDENILGTKLRLKSEIIRRILK